MRAFWKADLSLATSSPLFRLLFPAHKTFRNCQNAGLEYIEVSRVVRNLHIVLRALPTEPQKTESNVFKQDTSTKDELLATANSCKYVFGKLGFILAKYESPGVNRKAGSATKIWQRLRFGSKIEYLDNIRRS